MPTKPILIVGTSALYRRTVAEKHFADRYELVFLSPDIDEKKYRADDASGLTSAVSKAKMAEVLALVKQNPTLSSQIAARPGSAAITFDQVVVWNDEIREKPTSTEELRRFVRCYSDSHLSTVQSTASHVFSTGAEGLAQNITTTYYRLLPDDVIERVVRRGHAMHAAGGFTVEDEDMRAHMIRIDPGTEEEVRGFCAAAVEQLLADGVVPSSEYRGAA